VKFVLHIEGACTFYHRPDDQGTDIWMIADAHHMPSLTPTSKVLGRSTGVFEGAIPMAGWGVRICQGRVPYQAEIPGAKLTVTPDPMRVPSLLPLNTSSKLRPDLENATPENLPAALNSLVRLPGGELRDVPPEPSTYSNEDWRFNLPDGTSKIYKLTHAYCYVLPLQTMEPITLMFHRGGQQKWIELEVDQVGAEAKLAIEDVKGHENLKITGPNNPVLLTEWEIQHRVFETPTPVTPTTKFVNGSSKGGPIGVSDPLCPGGQIP
jgi:hypothetical protein